MKLEGTVKAGRVVKCGGCMRDILAGEKVYSYRERALTYHEACHGGLYPKRRRCEQCASRAPQNEEEDNMRKLKTKPAKRPVPRTQKTRAAQRSTFKIDGPGDRMRVVFAAPR